MSLAGFSLDTATRRGGELVVDTAVMRFWIEVILDVRVEARVGEMGIFMVVVVDSGSLGFIVRGMEREREVVRL